MIISNFIDLVCESLFERIERIFVVINLISRRETLGYLRSDSVNAGESCFRVVHEVSFVNRTSFHTTLRFLRISICNSIQWLG